MADEQNQVETAPQATQKMYTQSEVDRIASQAQKSREAHLLSDFEKKMEETNKRIYESELKANTIEALEKENLLDLAKVVNKRYDSVEDRVNGAKEIDKLVNALVEKRMAEKLKTSTPASNLSSPESPLASNGAVNMSKDELEAKRKQYKIY